MRLVAGFLGGSVSKVDSPPRQRISQNATRKIPFFENMNYQDMPGLCVGSFSSPPTSAHPDLNFEKDTIILYYIWHIANYICML